MTDFALKCNEAIFGHDGGEGMVVGFAGDGGDALATEHEADAGERGGGTLEKVIVVTAAASEPEAGVVEGEAGDEDAIDFGNGDAGAAEGIGFAQAERAGDDDLVPIRDFVPVELRSGLLVDHERKKDAFMLGPGFLDQRVDVRFGGEGGEEGDGLGVDEGGEVGHVLAEDEGGFGAVCRCQGTEAGEHFAAQFVFCLG
jgi:hypothetical protein